MWQQTTQHSFLRNKLVVLFKKKSDYLINPWEVVAHRAKRKGGKKCRKDWRCSPGEESKQHVWRVKKPITVNQAAEASQAGGRETLSNMNLSEEWTRGMSHLAWFFYVLIPHAKATFRPGGRCLCAVSDKQESSDPAGLLKRSVIPITTGNN